MTQEISRRGLLKRTGAGTGVLAALGASTLLAPTVAASPATEAAQGAADSDRRRRTSANGWELVSSVDADGPVWTQPVVGTGCEVSMRVGAVATVLVHVIRRFHYEVRALTEGDVIGWRSPSSVPTSTPESNQASGTAVAILPGSYPPGAEGGYFPHQLAAVRNITEACDGLVRWGGDDSRPYEALFSIDVPPGDPRLPALAATIRHREARAGTGAGTLR
ncbi:hypothetical protein [Actinopolyspora mortivallis]|uniref:Twin-arginine translocation signal domain-containing protein n=1 Tax=Actinopolyspora mortivallis TaxID=33906 RepID=A0A2T0H034_ACTMO|nr:hypothetical protein [Actinopolyspora mortivallis]PRW64728.1 hypothetical protein CEP50_02495 [Actinopolyspora mortivallis]